MWDKRRLAREQMPPGISVITVAEIEAGVREPERKAVEALVFRAVDLSGG